MHPTVPSSRQHGRRQRGGALVETALMMLVLIPLLLYAIFLMDAAYLKLDLQETVVSGIWDFSTRNAESGSASDEMDTPMRAVRASYSDHTSAFEDGAEVDPDVAADYGNTARITGNHLHEKHHKVYFAAQYTFRWEGADTQFLCNSGDDMNWNLDPLFKGFGQRFGTGGYVKCEATGYIYNYLIPQKLFTNFTDVDMSKLTRRQGDSHQFQGEGGNTANIVAYETAAISFNTWALRNGAPNGGGLSDADIGVRGFMGGAPTNVEGPFYDRVVYDYTDTPTRPSTYTPVRLASAAFTAKAASNNSVGMTAVTAGPTMRSVAGLPNMAGVFLVARYQPRKAQDQVRQKPPGLLGGAMHQGFQSTPYSGVNNNYRTAYRKRGTGYMGCRQPERDRCN
ncbi:MAG TPA: hypothetical protein VLQ93_01465 [Myxococcaceae bacterium]|nr:hypothetical protein [Myxococcaceae bacterium]